MEFSILGPLEVRADGRAVALGGVKPRAVLAALLLRANEPVTAERLALALWGEDAPASAGKTVQVHVSRLRHALGEPQLLTTTPAGYILRVQPGELDVERFDELAGRGRKALDAGDAERAAVVLREALALWRGPALADLASEPFAAAEIARLEESRLAAIELRVQADLEAGRHAELASELQQLTREHPWRERLHAQLMLALYRNGRQAEALDAYARARTVLVEELGIEPGPELAELQQKVLAQDPCLTPFLRAPSSLPAPPNRMIGREEELETVAERLDDVRLLTLTGPGGVGKTRLALETARTVEGRFADGATFVPLAPLRRAEDVASAVVSALGAVVLSGESAEDAIVRFLTPKQLLLIFDNFEHVLAAVPLVARVVEACPRVTVLATSREPLGLHAEHRHAVPTLADAGAAGLFVERARAHDPGFDEDGAVPEICRRLDGLPLAIELAAARCALLSAREIAERLDEALAAGARDAPERQRTLRATIDWSHALLDEEERVAFARFAVFAGGATIRAAEAVTGAGLDVLERLVAKSLLVRRSFGGRTRLFMLETVRVYAAERLAEAADAAALRERHYRHYLALVREHADNRVLSRADSAAHIALLDAEIDNVRAALWWALGSAEAGPALALTAALDRYWLRRSRYAEAIGWIDRVLALPGADAHPALLAPTLHCKLWCLWPVGRSADQPAVLAELEQAARRSGDPVLITRALITGADYASALNDADRTVSLAGEALVWAERSGDEWEVASALRAQTRASAASGADVRPSMERAEFALRRVGNVLELADLLISAAYGAVWAGDDLRAREYVDRAAPIVQAYGDPFMSMILSGNRGLAALFTADLDEAKSAFRDQLQLARELVVIPVAAEGLLGLAAIAAAEGDFLRAARLRGNVRGENQQDVIEARVDEQFLREARTRPEWAAGLREGAGMSFEEAIAFALEEAPTLEESR
jgi:predicted ATPase/DNA-binding SARP family transcriptional activator